LNQILSKNTVEILEDYALRPNGPRPGLNYYPPLDPEKHINEEYRLAWEEFYSLKITNNIIVRNIQLSVNPVNTLSMIASTNSIPMLVGVYKEMLKEHKLYRNHHLAILGILLHIDAPEALDTVFALLDYSDAELGVNKLYDPHANETLRERIMNVILDPKPNPRRTESYKPVKKPEELRRRFEAYQNPNLSTRNQAFVGQVREATRLAGEQKPNEETPSP
jgi:hypothetical protein